MDTKVWLSGAASLHCTAFKSRLLPRKLLSFSSVDEIYGELMNADKSAAAACGLFSIYLKRFLYEHRVVLLGHSYPIAASRALQPPLPAYTVLLQLVKKDNCSCAHQEAIDM